MSYRLVTDFARVLQQINEVRATREVITQQMADEVGSFATLVICSHQGKDALLQLTLHFQAGIAIKDLKTAGENVAQQRKRPGLHFLSCPTAENGDLFGQG